MNDKLVEKFLTFPHNLRMGSAKLARRWRASEEAVRAARTRAREIMGKDEVATLSNHIADLETELVQKVNREKGTLESTAICNYEAKTDEELAILHRIDLTKYRISSYWSKLKGSGKFTSSVFCTLRKIEDDPEIQVETVRELIIASLGSRLSVVTPTINVSGNGKALLIITSDEHVAAANLEDDLYNIPYDKTEYIFRKMAILQEVEKLKKLHGAFDDLINITLGDNLDGWNGGTTRSGEPGHAHILPQNMNNKQAVETYIRVNNFYWDEIMQRELASKHYKYDMVNSNHGGNGLDYIASLGVEIYLQAKYPGVDIHYFHKLLGHFEYGPHTVILTHGKDENYKKRPMPLNLNPETEVFIKQYMDINRVPRENHNLFLKGDLHQWNWNSGKFFDYVNVGSLYGSSGWVQSNFGLTRPSFVIGYLDKQSKDFNLKPVYLETPLP